MKWNKRQQQMTFRESDRRIVPLQPEHQSGFENSGNAEAGKAARNSRDRDWPLSVLRDGTAVLNRLDRISQRAEGDPETVFNNLFSLLDFKLLWQAFGQLKKGKAPGIDGVTLRDYGEN